MVTDSPSGDNDGGGGTGRPLPLLRYGDQFEELCPYYMSLGMSYHDFWDGDCCMAKYYREADEIRRERHNSEIWLQAAYIYEALLDASPVFNPLSKQNKPHPFRSEPIPITASGNKQAALRKKQKQMDDGKAAMRLMMAAFNKRFESNKTKGGIKDERRTEGT